MTTTRVRDELNALVADVLHDVDYADNPFFVTLRDGSFSKEDFIETQFQFHSAVTFFNRPMAALAAKIPDPMLRAPIVKNVWEEHGEGDPAKMHGATFELFLARLTKGSIDDVKRGLERRALWPEMRAFNTLLVGCCVLDDYLVGAGVMGAVERMFSEISMWIGRAVVARGFLAADEMVHYDVHEKLDVQHAADFFHVLESQWDAGPSQRYQIEQGLRMGAIAFDQLYARLYRCRARRWFKEHR